MKRFFFLLILLSVGHIAYCGSPYNIQPKVGANSGTVINGQSQSQLLNKVGGYFRNIEVSANGNERIETSVVTYFLSKTGEKDVLFQVNCADPISLYYVFSDQSGKHNKTISFSDPYQRFEQSVDLSSFKNGDCTIAVYDGQKQLISRIEFQKVEQ
jgi:hypothetical protein